MWAEKAKEKLLSLQGNINKVTFTEDLRGGGAWWCVGQWHQRNNEEGMRQQREQ